MPYLLGVDVGTSFTAAAVARLRAGEPPARSVLKLGQRSDSVPSVIFFGDEEQVLVGESAERRGLERPDRLVREFKRRVGDEVPIVVGNLHVAPHDILATMVRWVVDRAEEREGEAPAAVILTHPAGWGEYKKALLREALAGVGLAGVDLISEPAAAALHYATQERVDAGSVIAVYDLGGGTFDIALLRKNDSDSFDSLGHPEGLERLGGADFDEAVFRHVVASSGGVFSSIDVDDSSVLVALNRLRRECVEAKEALSFDSEATIPVLLPGAQRHVRLVRSEFELMIEDDLRETISTVVHATKAAGVEPEDLSSILLIGGSSRIPLVAELLSAELGRPIAIDADPKTSIALGAAFSAVTTFTAAATAAAAERGVELAAEEKTADAADGKPVHGRLGGAFKAGRASPNQADAPSPARHPIRLITTAAAVVAGLFIVAGPASPISVGIESLLSDGGRNLGFGGAPPANAAPEAGDGTVAPEGSAAGGSTPNAGADEGVAPLLGRPGTDSPTTPEKVKPDGAGGPTSTPKPTPKPATDPTATPTAPPADPTPTTPPATPTPTPTTPSPDPTSTPTTPPSDPPPPTTQEPPPTTQEPPPAEEPAPEQPAPEPPVTEPPAPAPESPAPESPAAEPASDPVPDPAPTAPPASEV
jgi:molecular chaperone DnaK